MKEINLHSKSRVRSLIYVALLVSPACSRGGQARSEWLVASPSRDQVHEVPAGVKHSSFSFTLVNESKHTVHLLRTVKSCSCADIVTQGFPVTPGASASVEMAIEAPHYGQQAAEAKLVVAQEPLEGGGGLTQMCSLVGRVVVGEGVSSYVAPAEIVEPWEGVEKLISVMLKADQEPVSVAGSIDGVLEPLMVDMVAHWRSPRAGWQAAVVGLSFGGGAAVKGEALLDFKFAQSEQRLAIPIVERAE